MPEFSEQSLAKLNTCHPDLVSLFLEVVKHADCTVVSGIRTLKEQQLLYAQGRTMPGQIVTNLDGVNKKSRHQGAAPDFVKSDAVDVIPYPIDWKDRDRFHLFAGVVLGIASQMGINITWGGDWDNDYDLKDQSFADYPHYELEK